MKTKNKVVMALCLFALIVPAWGGESEANPDRHVSFALQMTNGTLNGSGVSTEYLYSLGMNTNVPIEDNTANEVTVLNLNPSMRFPVSNRLTIDMGLNFVRQTYDYAGTLTRFHGYIKGELYSVGFRYYFPE